MKADDAKIALVKLSVRKKRGRALIILIRHQRRVRVAKMRIPRPNGNENIDHVSPAPSSNLSARHPSPAADRLTSDQSLEGLLERNYHFAFYFVTNECFRSKFGRSRNDRCRVHLVLSITLFFAAKVIF